MSSAFGLVKFKTTGNIYYGCYNGTCDIFLPFIFTAEECYNEQLDCYCAITYGRELNHGRDWAFPDDVNDLDDVEIYSSYGGGFYWHGTGSESVKMIKDYLDPFEEVWPDIIDGTPQWAEEFLIQLDNT